MARLTPDEIQNFQSAIFENFRTNGRAFPWRETRDPYRIMVSEIMLQQTQTERVVSKYLEWLDFFPTLEALADAPFSEVLAHWVGLGYNRRARYLQESAKLLIEKYQGVYPPDPDELDALPGIGPYTARAISTFVFNIPHAFIETNIRAVYIFFFFPEPDSVTETDILDLVKETLYSADPRTWYYALMDYGAALKKKVTNPNRKSLQYRKQSRFDGSLRQARGAIVRFLSAGRCASLDLVALSDNLPQERLERAARALVAEGLVCEKDGVYRIS